MGLDQFAFSKNEYGEKTEIAYWRKHNRLQGFMEALWVEQEAGEDGNTEDFNCVDLELTEEDLNKLEKAVITYNLPQTGGFFFGQDSYEYRNSQGNYEDYEDDIAFIAKGREVLANGDTLIYSCWW
jgi:hypothetical protein